MKILTLFVLIASFQIVNAAPILPASTPPNPEIVDGHDGGGAYSPAPGIPLAYPLPLMDAGAGTLAMWVKPDTDAAGLQDAVLLSTGAPPGTWLLLRLHEGTLNLVFQRGERPFAGPGEFYYNTSVDVSDWTESTWRHVLIRWAALGDSESAILIHVDGEEREARYDVRLASGMPVETLFIGANSARVAAPPGDFRIDGVRVWNLPLRDEDLPAVMNGDDVEPSALVLAVDFEAGLDAVSTAEVAPDFTDRSVLAERIKP